MKITNLLKGLNTKRRIMILLVFLIPIIICDGLNYFEIPENKPETEPGIRVLIPKGATLQQISDSLVAKDILDDPRLFRFWAVTLGYDTQLKAGLFEVPKGLNPAQVLEYLTQARAEEIYVTLLEGWQNGEISRRLSEKLGLSAEIFDSLCTDETFISEFGLEEDNLTGYLLPETYAFYWGMKESDVVRFLVNKTLDLFESDSVRKAMSRLKMDRHQILTMASIIEGEAIIDEERPVISSVYYNRIKRGMRLQADPTIQFIIPGPPRRLLERDLRIDSPYNTYLYAGLPPGPINNPGKSSIMAALFPADTNYLYFVAKGDGGHTFSRTLREHNRAKAAFDKIRRQVRQQKKSR